MHSHLKLFPASPVQITRRQLLAGSAALVAQMNAGPLWAEEVTQVLVGFPAGGAIDTTARVYASTIKHLGPWIVDNRVGAAGNIAAGALAQAKPDGNTLMLAPVNVYCISQATYKKPGFDTARDFASVGIVARFPWALAVHPSIPANTFAELIEWIKANPKKAFCGMAAIGSEGHLTAYALSKAAGIDLTFAPYRGGAPMAQDLMGGQIPMAFDPIVNLAQPHKAGKIRILAVSSATRTDLLPDVPTFSEIGYPAASVETWIGASVRSGTPAPRIQALSAAFESAARTPEVRNKLAALGLTATSGTPSEMSKVVAEDTQRYTALVKAIGLQIE